MRQRGTGSVRELKGKWRAFPPGRDSKSLGTFDTEEQASTALDAYIAGNPMETPPRRKRGGTSEMHAVTRGVGRYLNEVEAGVVDGKATVILGALGNGLPQRTTEPADVERAISIIKQQAREGTAVQRLERHQRVITLTRQLEVLTNANAANGDAHAFFIAHAREWATAKGVGYAAFRTMGVPVEVLTEAGITRTFEP